MYRREAVLAQAREMIRAGEAGEIGSLQTRAAALEGVVASLDADVIEGADLDALREEEG